MSTFAQKQKPIQQTKSANSAKPNRSFIGPGCNEHSILHLQRMIGNRAMQRLLPDNAEELNTGLATTSSIRFADDFSQVAIHQKARAKIQPKLTVGTPGDLYEREADHVANQVMQMPEAQLQRTCACGGECPQCQTGRGGQVSGLLQAKFGQDTNTDHTVTPSFAHNVLRSPGQPLDRAARRFMEPRFNHNFSHVRVHTDARAAQSARALNARAYTLGRDVVFGAGEFAPGTASGNRLLAHELTHVLQQTGTHGASRSPLRIARQQIKDEADTFTELDRLWMKEMLERFAAMSDEDLNLLLENVDKYADIIHEERMKAALLAVRHKRDEKTNRRKFEKDHEGLLAKVNRDQVALILDQLRLRTGDKAARIQIFVSYDRVAPVSDDEGEWYPLGYLSLYKKGRLVYQTKVSGGGHMSGLTTEANRQTVRRKHGRNYSGSNGPMAWPVFFNATEAIHQGELDHSSMACVHVPDMDLMETINKTAKKKHTEISIYYKKAVLDQLCPLRIEHLKSENKKSAPNPCHTYPF